MVDALDLIIWLLPFTWRMTIRVAEGRRGSLREVIRIDSLDFVLLDGCNADAMIDHQFGKLVAIHQHNRGPV